MKRYIIGIDEGTTSARAGIFDTTKNKLIAISQTPMKLIFPKPDWVEIDAEEIWETQKTVILQAVKKAKIKIQDIISLGITNQRESVIPWNKKTGKPLANAIIWQCRRSAPIIEKLTKSQKQTIKDKTGLIPDAYFSAGKMQWLLENNKKVMECAKNGNLCLGTVDSFLCFKLTGNFVCDTTNASRTMLFNIKTMKYDNELLKIFGVKEEYLPKVVDSNAIIGETNILGDKITVCGVIGDQQSALFGQSCFHEGMMKNTYGTGNFMLINTGEKIVETEKILSDVAYTINGKTTYALEGGVFNCGSNVQWLRDNLNLFKKSADTEKMAFSVADNGGVYLVPAFTGLGAPFWNMNARGTIIGLTRSANKNHIARACLETMTYSTKAIVEEIENTTNIKLKEMRADGGASENAFMMQYQADILQIKITLPQSFESTLMGAIYMSGLGMKFYKNLKDIEEKYIVLKHYLPTKNKHEKEYEMWKKAVSRSLDFV